MRTRVVVAAVIAGLAGALVSTFFVSAPAADGGAFVDPSFTMVASALWGAATGAAAGALAWMGPPRTTIPLGLGFLAAAVSAIGGVAFAVHLMGHDLLDGNPSVHMGSALAAAGIGWCLGAAVGMLEARVTLPMGDGEIRVARWTMLGLAVTGVLVALWLGAGEGVRDVRGSPATPVMQAIATADGVLIAVTLAVAAGTTRSATVAPDASPGLVARSAARLGMVLACVTFVLFAASVPGGIAYDVQRSRAHANAGTVGNLLDAGRRYVRREGDLPVDIDDLLDRGARVLPGTSVIGVWRTRHVVCVSVGTSSGTGSIEQPFQHGSLAYRLGPADRWRLRFEESGVGDCPLRVTS
jgi:hypothetical protein